MRNMVEGVICFLIVFVICTPFFVFELFALQSLGITYDSLWSLVFFYVVYTIVKAPITFVADAIPMFFKQKGWIRSSKGLFYFALHAITSFALICSIDYFLQTVSFAVESAMIFAIFIAGLHWLFTHRDPDKPIYGTAEWDALTQKFKR